MGLGWGGGWGKSYEGELGVGGELWGWGRVMGGWVGGELGEIYGVGGGLGRDMRGMGEGYWERDMGGGGYGGGGWGRGVGSWERVIGGLGG